MRSAAVAAVTKAGTGPDPSAVLVAADVEAAAALVAAVVPVPSAPAEFFLFSSRYYGPTVAAETSTSRRRCIR